MRVLSLFDGISCGRVALDRLNVPVEQYVAFEIDKYATSVSRKNFPDIIHKGDVFNGNYTEYKGFDILLGGSPCFTKGNLVLTNKGLVPIEDIKVGDMVLTHKNRYQPVTHIGNKISDVYSVKFLDTPEFKVTNNHPFYVKELKMKWNENLEKNTKVFSNYKWVTVENFNKNIYSVSPILDTEINDYKFTRDECYILGLLLSGGKIKNNKIFLYPTQDVLVKLSDERLLENSSQIITSENKYKVIIKSNKLVKIVKGQKLLSNNIPYISSLILNLPIELAKSFIVGFLHGSGGCSPRWGTYSIPVKDKSTAYSLGLLIQKVYNVNPHIFVQKCNDTKKYIIVYDKIFKSTSISKKLENKILSPFGYKKYIGKDTVYNISVAEDESYVCNNKIVHNCTYWSIAKNNREVTPDGIGGQLFMQYVRALKESKCEYFIYENNNSIHKDIKDFISEQLGVQPIMINSALVSAQQRKRCYWTNIPGVTQPNDKKIIVNDILEGCNVGQEYEINPKGCAMRGRYLNGNSGETQQRIEIRKDDKTNAITTVTKDCLLCIPIRIGTIGNGGQGERIYSVKGKSVTLSANGGGRGAKTGLYKIDLPDGDYIIRRLTPVEAERLQTLPDNYTAFGMTEDGKLVKISNTQRYKQVGNGWTVDVIAHLLSFIK